jgi:hypothetical protein
LHGILQRRERFLVPTIVLARRVARALIRATLLQAGGTSSRKREKGFVI